MLKYFKIYEKDKDDFLYEGNGNGLFSGSVVSKMCGIEKSFLVSIARTQTRPYDPDRSTIVFALDYDERVHTDSLILVSKFKSNRATEFIKVYLYDNAEEAKIQADYHQGWEVKEEKKKYYISMPLPITYDYFHYEKGQDYIIIKDQIDRRLKKVNAKLAGITKDGNRVLEIEISPKHLETTYTIITGHILIYTTTDEEVAQYKSIKIFEVLDEALRYETPKISNKLEEQWSWDYKPLNMSKKETETTVKDIKRNGPEAKLGDYIGYMSTVRPPSIHDIWRPWTHNTGDVNREDYVKYSKADAEVTSALYEERKMTIKDIKRNGPATIVFWLNGEKTIVKCQPGDQDDVEKGVIMALVKGIVTRQTNKKNWTSVFDIPYADEIDVEKVIGLAIIKDYCAMNDLEDEWHYRQVLKWVYKIENYTFEDEVKALLALGYSKYRIKKCLNTNLGAIRDALEPKTETEKSNEYTYADALKDAQAELEQYKVNLEEETNEEPKDIPMSDKVMEMFNKGIKIAQIARELGITEYFVKKALDEATKPKSNLKKVDKVLKKAVKNSKKEKKERKPHVILTEVPFVDYLTKEENEQILEMTKQKYAGKYKYLSELRDFYIREAKLYKIQQCYGNGYTMYEIAGILGISASGVQRIWNQANTSGGDPSEK